MNNTSNQKIKTPARTSEKSGEIKMANNKKSRGVVASEYKSYDKANSADSQVIGFDWGSFLKEKRTACNFTQAELSEKLNYPNPQFVSLMERSLSKIPLTTMGRLIQILNLNEEEVIAKLIEDYSLIVRSEIRKGQELPNETP